LSLVEGVFLKRVAKDVSKTFLKAVIKVTKKEMMEVEKLDEFIIKKLTLYDLLSKELTKV
jgi:hypothetical protein